MDSEWDVDPEPESPPDRLPKLREPLLARQHDRKTLTLMPSELNPPRMTAWMTPIRAHTSMVTAALRTIGTQIAAGSQRLRASLSKTLENCSSRRVSSCK